MGQLQASPLLDFTLKLMGKGQIGTFYIAGIRNKGVLDGAISQEFNVIPNAHIPDAGIAPPHIIQQQHTTAIHISVEVFFQLINSLLNLSSAAKAVGGDAILKTGHQIPMGL